MIIKRIKKFIKYHRVMQRINLALARGAATNSLRVIDPSDPNSWEFCAFSQNSEDGIIDYLCTRIHNPNYYFIEIGSSDGIENNTAWLAIAKKYSGIMIEGDDELSASSKEIMFGLNIGVECVNMFVNIDNLDSLINLSIYKNPDVFSLDIDGNDYYIAKVIMEMGFRPKIIIVEYNSVYGPSNRLTINYMKDFDVYKAHKTQLYYGVSIAGWKRFFNLYDYEFITVEKNGVNAFFADKNIIDAIFLENINGIDFKENFYQLKKFKVSWEKQFDLIKDMTFYSIA